MCGVVGQFLFDSAQPDESVLREMVSRLAHRGPDDAGIWVGKNIGLGHTRLAIRDLSSAGHQPMSINDGQIASSYNGEIYNDLEIRAKLRDEYKSKLVGHCDAETIPWAFLEWGVDAFKLLRGMYAIALWDSRERCLYLARDPVGIKPLYYAVSSKGVIFASEAKALESAHQLKVDSDGLHTFLATGHVGPERTWLKNVSQVPPGTVLRFDHAGINRITTWEPKRTTTIADRNTALAEFLPMWRNTVNEHLVSDVPLALMQSGGVDSSLVSLALSKEASVTAFTATFQDTTYDETDLAQAVSTQAGMTHQAINVEGDRDPIGTFKKIIWHSDGQCGDTGIVPFWQLSKAVSQHTKVALTGDGGDEFFAGYDTYAASRMITRLPSWLVSRRRLWDLAASIAQKFNRSHERLPSTEIATRFFKGLATSGELAHVEWRRLVYQPLVRDLYGLEMQPLIEMDPLAEYKNSLAGANDLNACLLADQRFHIHSILRKADYCSMAHGLELRVPLLDENVLNFSSLCAAEVLWDGGKYRKTLLRSALQKLNCPPHVLAEPKKGFNAPIANMLSGVLRSHADAIFVNDVDRMSSYVRPPVVQRLWGEHLSGRHNHAFALWPLLVFGTALQVLNIE